jgi:hypothetical protein
MRRQGEGKCEREGERERERERKERREKMSEYLHRFRLQWWHVGPQWQE